jgi:hypothetical protein
MHMASLAVVDILGAHTTRSALHYAMTDGHGYGTALARACAGAMFGDGARWLRVLVCFWYCAVCLASLGPK